MWLFVVIPSLVVLPSEARDLGVCLKSLTEWRAGMNPGLSLRSG